MATSGTCSKAPIYATSTGNKAGDIYASWSVSSQNKKDRTTTISVYFWVSMSGYSFSANPMTWTINCAGQTRSGSTNMSVNVSGIGFIATEYFTITHDADGNKAFSITATASRTNPNNTYTSSGSFELPQLPVPAKLTGADDFNDEGNPSIYYESASGDLVDTLLACISFTGAEDNVPYRPVTKTGSSYTFELTDAERTTLRRGVVDGGSRSVIFYLRTTIDGQHHYSTLTKTMSLINHEPTLNPTAKDTNERTVLLTGDNTKFIQYFSNVRFETGAQAHKEASINYQFATCGGKTIEGSTGILSNIASNTIYYGATDNRGFSVRDFTTHTLVPYIKLTSSLSMGLLTANGTVKFTIKGKYFNGNFGAKRNSMEVEYAVRDKDGNFVFNPSGSGWVQLGTVSPSVTGDDYTYSYTITGLDYTQTYTVIVNVIDELTPVQQSSAVVSALPVFDWNANDFHHHTDIVFSNSRNISGMRPDGSEKIALEPCNQNGNTTLGYGGYAESNGDTNVYGNNVRLTTRENLIINGRTYGAQQILWQSTGYYMNGAQTASLSQKISDQPNGIILVFSLYRNGAAEDISINSFFVSKKEVELLPGAPHTFLMAINSGLSVFGAKYLYISDDAIIGHATNATNATTAAESGIKYSNANFVLRYVIGV